jgi:hypothetical protein
MMHLYFDLESGYVGYFTDEPTDEDLRAVEQGVVRIFQFNSNGKLLEYQTPHLEEASTGPALLKFQLISVPEMEIAALIGEEFERKFHVFKET